MATEGGRANGASRTTTLQTKRSWLGDGWIDLLGETASRAYLIFMATLAAIAFVPALAGWTGSVVQSGSMQPLISPGDVVVTVPLPTTKPFPIGRVITFTIDDETIVHRIVSVNPNNSLVTAGDANPEVDPWSASRADITGQARLLVPYIGLPSFWLSNGKFVALGGWAALTLLAVLVATRRRTRIPSDPAPTDADTREAKSGDAPTQGGAAGGRLKPAVAGVAALGVLLLAFGSTPPAFAAPLTFSKQTRSGTSWAAKSYSPISVGAMTGYAAIAGNSIRDGSFLFHFSSASGSVATSPGTTVTNVSVDGTTDRNNAAATRAMAAATTARSALNERSATSTLAPTLSGTLPGGVYASSTGAFAVPTTLTLDAKGDSTARFVFRTTSTLTTADRSRIILANGAKASNVWWIVGTTATLGTNTALLTPDTTAVGTYLVAGAVSIRGVALTGRIVSYTDSITLYASTLAPSD